MLKNILFGQNFPLRRADIIQSPSFKLWISLIKCFLARRRRKKLGVFLARRRRKKIENFAKNPDFFGSRFGPNHTQVPDPPPCFQADFLGRGGSGTWVCPDP